MRQLIIALATVFLLPATAAYPQLTLDHCREKARANYPLIKQYGLIEKSATYNLSNAGKGYLPQVTLTAKATYQSETTEIPINIPGIPSFAMSKDQYQAITEVNQLIWDGGAIRSQKKIIQQSAEVEKQNLEVALYTLNERINQLFFGILVIQEQLRQNDLLRAGWQTNIERVTAWINNGVANQSDLDALKVEQLRTAQRSTELLSLQKSYKQMLSAMTGEQIDEGVKFVKPESSVIPVTGIVNHRPELQFFEYQKNLLNTQRDAIYAANRPKIGMFLQAGYGRPGLNMLNNQFSPFAIGGARITWNISNYYSQKNNVSKLGLSGQSVDLQKDIFIYNLNLSGIQQNNEIAKIRELIGRDDEIISLRQSIRKSSEVKVANGTLMVSELIRDIQAEDMARQEKSLHEMQLLISIYNLKNITNN
jgi:outer membrane protein TolC